MTHSLYIGRIVLVARTPNNALCGAYRVSSRSFPNRTAVVRENAVSIVPKPGHEGDVHKNPYIAYNCVRLVAGGKVAVVTNGSHTDPVAEKVDAGMPVRDALVLATLALDYEKDAYDTPRISAVLDTRDDAAWLGVVRKDGLEVRQVSLAPAHFAYVATYEENRLADAQSGAFEAQTAEDACAFVLSGGIFAHRTNPVTGVAALANKSGFDLAIRDY